MTPSCENCRHWYVVVKCETGQCRRYPPVATPDSTWSFPETYRLTNCGEWAPIDSLPVIERRGEG